MFVYRYAGAHSATLCIGVDSFGEAMKKTSNRALGKVTRGGAPNALFIIAAIEDLPMQWRLYDLCSRTPTVISTTYRTRDGSSRAPSSSPPYSVSPARTPALS